VVGWCRKRFNETQAYDIMNNERGTLRSLAASVHAVTRVTLLCNSVMDLLWCRLCNNLERERVSERERV
jgi:hypothetical protein